jgi:predicted metalloprotease with PDZ domain
MVFRFTSLLLLFLIHLTYLQAQQTGFYQYSVDLVDVKEDKIKVELIPPKTDQSELVYRFPKIVPGNYSINNFGRFIEDIKFYDLQNNELPAEKLDMNSWKISTKGLSKITYWVDDTYDSPIKKDFVFEPAGSNIEEGQNFVLNTHCLFGYFDHLKNVPFVVNFTKPEGFYGSTALQAVKSGPTRDTYMIPTYMELVDSPIMYCKPDTTNLKVGGANILVSVYSPKKILNSKAVADNIDEILNAAQKYFGGKLPIKKYAFIIYLFDKQSGSGTYGALEHSYSSMYYLPEIDADIISQNIKDIATHEFFHIITPLSIHSEEIHNFDYNNPEMSQHLWLYEGVTEYISGQIQVRGKLMEPEVYLEDMIREKIFDSERYKDNLPFTELSKKSLVEHKDQYQNVYQKGALIGMALDITLRDLSEGKYGIKELLDDLSRYYGKDKPFKDDELFDRITELTYPEIKVFFNKYVAGPEPLPYEEIFAKVGISYEKYAKFKYYTLGDIGLSYNDSTDHFVVADISDVNEIGKKINYRKGDELISINGKKVNLENLEGFYSGSNPFKFKENKKMKIVVKRLDGGKEKRVKLTAKAKKVQYEQKHRLQLIEKPTPKQLVVRKSWLGED